MAADDDLAPKRVAVAGAAANGGNFDGVALLEGRLYLCPYNADFVVCIDPTGDVLGCYERPGESPAVVDPSTGYSVSYYDLPAPLRGGEKWSGICACRGKLFCAPATAPGVLVVDPGASPPMRSIEGGRGGGGHMWDGICVCNGRLYCAPFDARSVLAIDPITEAAGTIDVSAVRQGAGKWSGCAAACGKVFCAPHNAGVVLVIDAHDGDAVSSIDCGYAGNQKWSGICASRGKLYCAPFNAASVLCVDPARLSMRWIETGASSPAKYRCIAAAGGRLFCAPYSSPHLLVVAPGQNGVDDADGVRFADCGPGGATPRRWSGVAACGGMLVAAQFDAGGALVVDQRAGDAPPSSRPSSARPRRPSRVSCAGQRARRRALRRALEFFDAAAPPPRPKFHYETAWEEDRAAPAAAEEDAPEDYTDVPLVDAKLALRDAFDAYPPLKPLPPGLTADV
ncbi:hypothetical protein JL722_4405 [Aureococcus anophagefferens]|nr:hypothetical protein JL722_4405 [Aureococcus anophagefferens]